MSKISEETTKGLVSNKLKNTLGYPTSQNVTVSGITWFKEDSYKGTNYNWLDSVFAKATKKQTLQSKGIPDFIVTKEGSSVIVVIECKGDIAHHSSQSDSNAFKYSGYGTPAETEAYAINGALWYATFLNDRYDVIAVGVSGQIEAACRVTSFVLPRGGKIEDIELLEDEYLSGALVSIVQYEKDVDVVLDRFAGTEAAIKKELRRYTLTCANFLRSNGIEDNSKAGFISAVILGLTNHESKLYKDTKAAIDAKRASKSKKLLSDPLGRNAVKLLKASLYGDGNEYDEDYIKGIWDIDRIPRGKRTSLKKFYDNLLSKDELLHAPKGDYKDFPDGETVLSRCVFSLYENVIEVLEKYTGIDVMGEFYTTFLRFTKGNAKEKGIVLTPKHITELFCDIAEYYSDTKFNENTKVIDICCGTGAFLIAALARMKKNISGLKISEGAKAAKYEVAQKSSLIGVEKDPSMYALAYANMRFHGDGKANLFNCSSLLIDSYAPVDDSGKTYLEDTKVPLHEALKSFGDIDIAMINPPYSLDKKDNSASREYPIIQKKAELEDKLKRLKQTQRALKKKDQTEATQQELVKLEKDIRLTEAALTKLGHDLDDSGFREIAISKGQDELDFVASMLHYLKRGGIGIAIVPMSCAGSSGTSLRTSLLRHHTLLACMTMPSNLFFDSHVGANTCIMVFKAHVPHDEQKSVFFGVWNDDGFSVIPHNGRKDTGKWSAIRQGWIDQLDGIAEPNETLWLKHKMNSNGEALPEAYVKTDNKKITEELFKNVVRNYALYKYMDSKSALDIKDSKKMLWLLDNYTDFENQYSSSLTEKHLSLTDRRWSVFKFQRIIDDIHNGKSYNNADLVAADIDDYILYITRTEQNNGVSMCVQAMDYSGLEKANAITIGDTTATIFFQDHDFITGPHMIVVRADWINVYSALFVITLLNQEKYRYPVFGRAFTKDLIAETQLYLPVDTDGNPDYAFMEEYIKSLPFSVRI